jgi:hypothetical protein
MKEIPLVNGSGKYTRKDVIGHLIALPAFAAALAMAAAPAQAKSSQAAFKYQSSPKNGAKCSGCKFFDPGASKTANGSCKLVDGSISPNGWCIAYSAK